MVMPLPASYPSSGLQAASPVGPLAFMPSSSRGATTPRPSSSLQQPAPPRQSWSSPPNSQQSNYAPPTARGFGTGSPYGSSAYPAYSQPSYQAYPSYGTPSYGSPSYGSPYYQQGYIPAHARRHPVYDYYDDYYGGATQAPAPAPALPADRPPVNTVPHRKPPVNTMSQNELQQLQQLQRYYQQQQPQPQPQPQQPSQQPQQQQPQQQQPQQHQLPNTGSGNPDLKPKPNEQKVSTIFMANPNEDAIPVGYVSSNGPIRMNRPNPAPAPAPEQAPTGGAGLGFGAYSPFGFGSPLGGNYGGFGAASPYYSNPDYYGSSQPASDQQQQQQQQQPGNAGTTGRGGPFGASSSPFGFGGYYG